MSEAIATCIKCGSNFGTTRKIDQCSYCAPELYKSPTWKTFPLLSERQKDKISIRSQDKAVVKEYWQTSKEKEQRKCKGVAEVNTLVLPEFSLPYALKITDTKYYYGEGNYGKRHLHGAL
jgi:hypothetical protein